MVTHTRLDTGCGFRTCKPDCLQPCARIGVFSAFYSIAALVTSTLNHYVNSQVTTLEKQFGFSSHQTGIIMAANDIGYLVCVLFVGYVASRSHIPRSLGIATITFGLSGITCSLPHFFFGATVNADSAGDLDNITASLDRAKKQVAASGWLCDPFNNTNDFCQSDSATDSAVAKIISHERIAQASFIIIVLGMAIQGFAKAPRSSFVVTFVDDNTAKANTGFYVGTITAVAVLGPACAYFMGGLFSRTYVTLQATTLTPGHRRWIGAWWLGYVVFGSLALIISLPLFWFPRKLQQRGDNTSRTDNPKLNGTPDTKVLAMNDVDSHRDANNKLPAVKNLHADDKKTFIRRPNVKFMLRHSRDFLASLCRLLTNPVYVLMVISSCCNIFTVAGSVSFTPKYLERMFHQPAYKANYIIAGQTLFTSSTGCFIGGYLSKRMKMTAMKGIKFVVVLVGIGFVFQVIAFFLRCDQPTVHNWPSEENSCNWGCNCRDNSYFPICGGDGRTYYSPCHAGCPQVEQGAYQNCTCIAGGQATAGTCDYGCSQVYGYPVVMGLRKMFATLSIIPNIIILIRCVSKQDKSMALAVSPFVKSLSGWLLAPIIYGNMIDGICTVWDMNCGVKGRCLLYDNNLFRVKLHAYGIVGVGLCLLFAVLAYVYARVTKCLDDVDQEDVNTVEIIVGADEGRDQSSQALAGEDVEAFGEPVNNGKARKMSLEIVA